MFDKTSGFIQTFFLIIIILAFIPFQCVADICFEAKPISIQGLPKGILIRNWSLADMQGEGHQDLILAGLIPKSDFSLISAAFRIKIKNNLLTVIDTIFPASKGTDKTKSGYILSEIEVYDLTTCDIDKDNRDEIFLFYDNYPSQMIKREKNRYVISELPIQALSPLHTAWFDYNGDGWTDLFVSGQEFIKKKPKLLTQNVACIWENKQGKLKQTDIFFDIKGFVDSAHVIDYNEDNSPDLFICARSDNHANPAYNHIYLNKQGIFHEVEFPFQGIDKLMGLGWANLVCVDLNKDSLSDIIISGWWNQHIGPKAFITLIYRKSMMNENGKKVFYLEYDNDRMEHIPNIRGKFIVEDLDRDGDKDIIVSGHDSNFNNRVICLENRNNNLEQVKTGFSEIDIKKPLGSYYGETVIPFDVNKDGYMDIICFPDSSDKKIMFLQNISKQ